MTGTDRKGHEWPLWLFVLCWIVVVVVVVALFPGVVGWNMALSFIFVEDLQVSVGGEPYKKRYNPSVIAARQNPAKSMTLVKYHWGRWS